jgi:hypothetical protein
MKLKLIFLFVFLYGTIFGQETFDIKNPGSKYSSKCEDCLNVLNSKPVEVLYGVFLDSIGNMYFTMSDFNWFQLLFSKNSDGIAIDIISKEQFECGNDNKITKSWANQGKLLAPVYLKEMKENLMLTEDNEVIVKIGKLPYKYKDKEIEFNILILSKKNLCYYTTLFNIERFKWDLLEMGLYMDTIVTVPDFDVEDSINEQISLRSKQLTFTIPFEKNKAEYSTVDIKPMTDSLLLNDYDITKIEISAFASVEGLTERNIELQNQRAESIIETLQSLQVQTIAAQVNTAENWVEFFNDIAGTEFSYLNKLSQTEIKTKLENEDLSAKIEPILKNHRKAVLLIDLEKKTIYTDTTKEGIKILFEKSIKDGDVEKATELQNLIFSKIINKQLPNEFLNEIELPQKTEFSILHNNKTAFKHLINETDVHETYLEFIELEKIFPDDNHIKYNICALKFDLWISGGEVIDNEDFQKEIKKLKTYGINESLVNRMLLNYNIIMSEIYMIKGDYTKKDAALKYIKTNYEKLNLTDADLLNIAQYFANYGKYDWATKIIKPRISKIDVSEDLLFYYINLTLINPEITEKEDYRIILENAMNLNKERFCKMFNSNLEDGISIQLLRNEYLKMSHCENCVD